MTRKAYKGLPMEGAVASWYARNTGRDLTRFRKAADSIAARIAPRSDILEVAPGPGYLAIDLARRGHRVAAIDISASFVRITRENARAAGVDIDVRLGDAAAMPFADGSFDFVVCMAAFKNFSDPAGALNEIHRVLRPGGGASIFDLRRDAKPDEIASEVNAMGLPAVSRTLTGWTFRFMLLKRAYTGDEMKQLAAASRFDHGTIVKDGIGFELRLVRQAAA